MPPSDWLSIRYRVRPQPALPEGMHCIYALADPTVHKVRYIGATRRWVLIRYMEHLEQARPEAGRSSVTSEWIASLVAVGLVPELRILEVVPDEQWASAEQKWIKKYIRDGLLNVTQGGPGFSRPMTEAHRANISLGILGKATGGKGKPKSPEHRAKIAASMRETMRKKNV